MKYVTAMCILLILCVGVIAEDLHGHDHDLDDLADLFELYRMAEVRPAWAPVPVLRGKTELSPTLIDLLDSADPVTRARSAFLLGQIGESAAVEPLAKGLTDTDRSVRVHCGLALAQMGDDRGISVCASVITNDPEWIRYYAVYGLWHLNSERARSVLTRTRTNQPEFIRVTIDQALSTPYKALPAVDSTSERADFDPQDLWHDIGNFFVREADWWWHMGDYRQAMRCLEAEVFFNPLHHQSYELIAWLEWSLGDDDAAIKTLNRGIAALPDDPNAHFALGFHYRNTERHDLSEEPLKKAVELGGDHLMQRQYAHCLERVGKLEESIRQWESLADSRPDDAVVRNNLNRVRKILENKEVSGSPEAN